MEKAQLEMLRAHYILMGLESDHHRLESVLEIVDVHTSEQETIKEKHARIQIREVG